MIDSRLYQANYLALPLAANENHPLDPQPNYLIIEDMYGRAIAEIPTIGKMTCQNAKYKIVFRQILPDSPELGRAEKLDEIIFEQDKQFVPVGLVPALSDYNYLAQGIAQVNMMLALFQFRGVMNGFQLIIDEPVLAQIILAVYPPPPPPPDEEEPPTEKPSTDEPPVDEPPTNEPPAEDPPVENPPNEEPPTET